MSQRTGFTGSALVRLLARLTEADVPESDRSISDRLGQWLRWTDAISLSSVLAGSHAASPARARAGGSAEEADVQRVRTGLLKTLSEEGVTSSVAMTDFSACRRRYLARQQAMETGIGPLRGRLRSALAGRSGALARLAAVDMVMEQALAAHEQRVLATVPTLLEKHFDRLRRAQAEQVDPDLPPDAWQAGFGKDMHSVLLAELDIRMQPIEGLLEALRTH